MSSLWGLDPFHGVYHCQKISRLQGIPRKVGIFHTVIGKRGWILLFGGGQKELAALDKLVWKKVD